MRLWISRVGCRVWRSVEEPSFFKGVFFYERSDVLLHFLLEKWEYILPVVLKVRLLSIKLLWLRLACYRLRLQESEPENSLCALDKVHQGQSDVVDFNKTHEENTGELNKLMTSLYFIALTLENSEVLLAVAEDESQIPSEVLKFSDSRNLRILFNQLRLQHRDNLEHVLPQIHPKLFKDKTTQVHLFSNQWFMHPGWTKFSKHPDIPLLL